MGAPNYFSTAGFQGQSATTGVPTFANGGDRTLTTNLSLTATAAPSSPLNQVQPNLSQGNGLRLTKGGSEKSVPDPDEVVQGPLKFPSQLGQSTHKWPMISFSTKLDTKAARRIFLPIPAGITFSDSMGYSSIDLGIIGKLASDAATEGFSAYSGGDYKAGIKAAGKAFTTGALDRMKSLKAAEALSIGMRQLRMDSVANIIDFSQKQVVAPNTNTAFNNIGVRSFAFSFKLMPRSKDEASTISAIVKTFRQNMYPKGTDVILQYPPIWEIKFFDGDGHENTKIPQIYSTYLTGMTTTYNGQSNMFHEDGNPTETDIQVQFQETKALTLAEIVNLSEK